MSKAYDMAAVSNDFVEQEYSKLNVQYENIAPIEDGEIEPLWSNESRKDKLPAIARFCPQFLHSWLQGRWLSVEFMIYYLIFLPITFFIIVHAIHTSSGELFLFLN